MKTYSFTHENIADRAREIWESEGRPEGRDTEIWLNAERQLMTPSRTRPVSRSKTSADAARPHDLEEDADPIANNALEERLSEIGEPPTRSATSL